MKRTTSKKADSQVKSAQGKGYSADYISIRKEMESDWPAWKVSMYNDCFATTAHARKLEVK